MEGYINNNINNNNNWYYLVRITSSFNMILVCRKVVQMWDCIQTKCCCFELAFNILQYLSLVFTTFIFACGGVIVGGIAGAMKGQTTETGICRGACIGALSGAIVSLELLDSIFNGHFLTKVGVFGSVLNGKAFREWVTPAVLKAYQWQTSMNYEIDENSRVSSDIYDIDVDQGMSYELINKLPVINFCSNSSISQFEICCTICLKDLMEGERARILPGCQHGFHLHCIHKWLERRNSCPICRNIIDLN